MKELVRGKCVPCSLALHAEHFLLYISPLPPTILLFSYKGLSWMLVLYCNTIKSILFICGGYKTYWPNFNWFWKLKLTLNVKHYSGILFLFVAYRHAKNNMFSKNEIFQQMNYTKSKVFAHFKTPVLFICWFS